MPRDRFKQLSDNTLMVLIETQQDTTAVADAYVGFQVKSRRMLALSENRVCVCEDLKEVSKIGFSSVTCLSTFLYS